MLVGRYKKARIDHAQRIEDTFLEKNIQWYATDNFDQAAQNIRGDGILPTGTGPRMRSSSISALIGEIHQFQLPQKQRAATVTIRDGAQFRLTVSAAN